MELRLLVLMVGLYGDSDGRVEGEYCYDYVVGG